MKRVPPMALVAATILLLCLSLVSLAAALRRRLGRLGLPGCFALLAGQFAALSAAAHSAVAVGTSVPGVGVAAAALAIGVLTAEQQLGPRWWARFERDLSRWAAERGASRV